MKNPLIGFCSKKNLSHILVFDDHPDLILVQEVSLLDNAIRGDEIFVKGGHVVHIRQKDLQFFIPNVGVEFETALDVA